MPRNRRKMLNVRKISNKERREQSTAFLKYLDTHGLIKPETNKEELRQAFNERFKSLWKTDHEGPIANFSSNLFQLKRDGFIRMNKSGEVTFCQGKVRQPLKGVKPQEVETVQASSSSQSLPGQTSSSTSQTSKKISPKHSIRLSVDQHITAKGDRDGSDDSELSGDGESPALPAAASSEAILPDGVRKTGGFYVCEMCKVMVNSKAEILSHLDGKKHRVQKLVLGFRENRDELIKKKSDIEVTSELIGPQGSVQLDGPQGTVRSSVEEGKVSCITFTISNKGKTPVTLVACELLRKLRMFQVNDPKRVCDGIGTAVIKPGDTYQVTMTSFQVL